MREKAEQRMCLNKRKKYIIFNIKLSDSVWSLSNELFNSNSLYRISTAVNTYNKAKVSLQDVILAAAGLQRLLQADHCFTLFQSLFWSHDVVLIISWSVWLCLLLSELITSDCSQQTLNPLSEVKGHLQSAAVLRRFDLSETNKTLHCQRSSAALWWPNSWITEDQDVVWYFTCFAV